MDRFTLDFDRANMKSSINKKRKTEKDRLKERQKDKRQKETRQKDRKENETKRQKKELSLIHTRNKEREKERHKERKTHFMPDSSRSQQSE